MTTIGNAISASTLRLVVPEIRNCRQCRTEFDTPWRAKWFCDSCVRNIRDGEKRRYLQEYAYAVPAEYARHSLAKAIGEASMDAWVLVLCGPPGTGKTCQLHHLLKSRAVYQRNAWFQAAGTLGIDLQEDREQIYTSRYLAIDDIGRRITPAIIEGLCLVLDHRHANHLPTYVSTNLRQQDVEDLDPRLASRLSAGVWLPITGTDKRVAR